MDCWGINLDERLLGFGEGEGEVELPKMGAFFFFLLAADLGPFWWFCWEIWIDEQRLGRKIEKSKNILFCFDFLPLFSLDGFFWGKGKAKTLGEKIFNW